MEKLKVCWISAGVSSFIAGYLERDTIDKFIYIDIDDQHPDSMRFIKDCEKVLGKEIEILKSSEYNTVEDCIRTASVLKMPYGFAPCTNWLKKRVRKQWEEAHNDYEITYVWGMDCIYFQPDFILTNDGKRRPYTEEEKELPYVSIDVGINCGSRCERHGYWEENKIPVWFSENDFCCYGERKESEVQGE